MQRSVRVLGVVSTACLLAHAISSFARGTPEDLLWFCNVGCLFASAGLLLLQPRLTGIGALWLSLGTPVWSIDTIARAGLDDATSLLTHLLCWACAIVGVRRLGYPVGTWFPAWIMGFSLQRLTQYTTPPRSNVNFAHQIWPGLDRVFHSYAWYLLACTMMIAVALWLVELVFRRFSRTRRGYS